MCVCVRKATLRYHPLTATRSLRTKSCSVGSPRWPHGETNESLCESCANLTCPRAATRGKVGGSGAWPRCVEKRFHGEKIRAANLNIIGNFACCCFDGSVSLNFSPFLSLRNVKDYWISFLFEKSIQIRILSVAAPFGNVSNNSRDRIRELSKKKFYSYL